MILGTYYLGCEMSLVRVVLTLRIFERMLDFVFAMQYII